MLINRPQRIQSEDPSPTRSGTSLINSAIGRTRLVIIKAGRLQIKLNSNVICCSRSSRESAGYVQGIGCRKLISQSVKIISMIRFKDPVRL